MSQQGEFTEQAELQCAVDSDVSAGTQSNGVFSDEEAVATITSESSGQQSSSSLPSQREFQTDAIATSFYDVNSRITVSTAEPPLLPKSRLAGEKVAASRPFAMSEMIVRKGRNSFTVETPVRIDEDRTLVFIAANYKKQPRGIIFDQRDSSVSFPDKAVTSIINGMSGSTSFSPDLLAAMDTACAAFLQDMVLGATVETREGGCARFVSISPSLSNPPPSSLLFSLELREQLEEAEVEIADLRDQLQKAKTDLSKRKAENGNNKRKRQEEEEAFNEFQLFQEFKKQRQQQAISPPLGSLPGSQPGPPIAYYTAPPPPPPPLPVHGVRHYDSASRQYWYRNPVTGQQQWEVPC